MTRAGTRTLPDQQPRRAVTVIVPFLILTAAFLATADALWGAVGLICGGFIAAGASMFALALIPAPQRQADGAHAEAPVLRRRSG